MVSFRSPSLQHSHTTICSPNGTNTPTLNGRPSTRGTSPLHFSGTWTIEKAHEHSGSKARTSFIIHQQEIKQLPEYVNLAFHDCYDDKKQSNQTWIEIQGTDLKNTKVNRGLFGHEPIDWMVERAIGRIRKWAKKQPIEPQIWEFMNPDRIRPKGPGWILEDSNITPKTVKEATEILNNVIGHRYPDPASPPPWVITVSINPSPDPNRYQLELIARRGDTNAFLLKHDPWLNGKPADRLNPLAQELNQFIEQVDNTWWSQVTKPH